MDDGADMEAGGDVATRTNRVQGVGGITGIAIALSIIGGAVYGVIKLVDLVTDDVGAGSPEP
jgi:hypothetical protein